MSMKNSNESVGNRPSDLPVCSAVLPQLHHHVPHQTSSAFIKPQTTFRHLAPKARSRTLPCTSLAQSSIERSPFPSTSFTYALPILPSHFHLPHIPSSLLSHKLIGFLLLSILIKIG